LSYFKEIQQIVRKGLCPDSYNSYEAYDHTIKQNEISMNMIASNLGIVNYLDDLLNEVVEKVKSR
jgi:hypothetical protein